MNYCIVESGVIVNIAEASAEYAAAQGWLLNQGWGIGWGRDGYGGFSELNSEPAPASAPVSCTRRQGRLALLAHGHLDDVEAAIAAITDPTEQRAAQIEYEADTWERGNPFVQQMWAQLGGTPAQLDDLFRLAVTL